MKVFRTYLISLFLLSVVISCSDPCDYERLEYIGNSIDVVDNSGLKPVSLTGNTIKSKVFGIFYQLQFENKKNPKLKTNNHLFLYLDPSIDTIQQFIINGYNNGLLISSDTTRPILLRR